ncbi:hypothetical protein [Paenibacillus koleovorans]|uniref:hypothetical protein n=1 Tax=Paenibacillus koleovorans TaxID=121608 RepID=UPI000FD6EE54|nr:hypothetical protein [Paenibacillus koleovorans]
MALLPRTCKQCSASFEGGPRAYYCPTCRYERTKIADALHKRKQRAGMVSRPLGSTDQCERCGNDYVVAGGLQRFCQTCKPIHAKEYDRDTSIEFYHENKERINPTRNPKRRKRSNICAWCQKVFEPVDGRTTCSDECKRLHTNRNVREWNARKK